MIVGITGGTHGIGKAIVDMFGEKGHQVFAGSRVNGVDVRNRKVMNRFIADMGRLDVFINNAGISEWNSIENIDEQFADEMISTNLLGTLWGCIEAANFMTDGGSIINISSLAGKRGSANNTVYCATKFAVNGITQSLAKELGPRGIRVNAVCPYYVVTPGLEEALKAPAAPYVDISATALGRLPTAEEVAQVVYWLASDQASAITGQCINVDCGAFPQ